MKDGSGIKDIFRHYLLNNGGKICSLGKITMKYEKLEKYLDFDNLVEFERPDGYSLCNDSICIFEHFEFDSTKKSRKGSQSKIEDIRVRSSFHKTASTDRLTVNHAELNIQHTSSRYIENALNGMRNHYEKVDSYIENLKANNILRDNLNIELGFFIEDTTILGNRFFVREGKFDVPYEVNLAQCKQFLDFFETCSKLDFCLCGNSFSNKIFHVNKDSIQEYRKSEIDLDAIELLDLKPKVVSCSVTVSDDIFKDRD